jgi:hypothetical protein
VSGLAKLYGEMREAVSPRERDSPSPHVLGLETPLPRLRDSHREGIIGFDGTLHADGAKRPLELLGRTRAHAAGASPAE